MFAVRWIPGTMGLQEKSNITIIVLDLIGYPISVSNLSKIDFSNAPFTQGR